MRFRRRLENWRQFWFHRVRTPHGLLWLASLVLTDGVALLTLTEAKHCTNDLSFGIALLNHGSADPRMKLIEKSLFIESTQCLRDIVSYAILLLFCSLMTFFFFKEIPPRPVDAASGCKHKTGKFQAVK